MKKNRLVIYSLLFAFAVGAIFLYQKTTIKQHFPEQKVKSYQTTLSVGIQTLLTKVPIEEIVDDKALLKDQLEQLIVSTNQIYTAYTELKAIAIAYQQYEEDREIADKIMANSMSAFTKMQKERAKKMTLSNEQLDDIKSLLHFYKQIEQLDIHALELGVWLQKAADISEQYVHLIEWNW